MTNGFINEGLVAYDFTAVDSFPTQPVGAIFTGSDGIYQYVKSAGLTQGDAAIISEAGLATQLTTVLAGAVPQSVGFALATSTANTWCFVWRGLGPNVGTVINAVAAGTALTTTATPGQVGTGGTAIKGLKSTALGVTNTPVAIFGATLFYVN